MARPSGVGVVRGGQATQHFIRMARQVSLFALASGVAVFGSIVATMCWITFERNQLYNFAAYELAEVRSTFSNNPEKPVGYYEVDGREATLPAWQILHHPMIIKQAQHVNRELPRILTFGGIGGGSVMILSIFLFIRVGKNLATDRHIRGQKLVTQPELRTWVQLKWKEHERTFGKSTQKGKYKIGGVPVPPNAFTSGIGIYGTVGAGKTVIIKSILDQMVTHRARAIIYDRTGALVRDFYDPERDVLYNPFDERSARWTPFCDARSKREFEQLAEVMIPDRKGGDPFWVSTARLVFADTAYTLRRKANEANRTPTLSELRNAILNMPNEQLAKLVEGERSQLFFDEDNARTAASIRSSIITELKFIEYLRDDGPTFSVQAWVQSEEPGFLFLTSPADQASVCRNTITSMIEIASNALSRCGETYDPRLFFVLDELPTLNKIPALLTSLATLRQFGAAFMLGFQVNSQLEEIYGREGARTIAGTLNTVMVLSTPDHETAKSCSERLGMQDQEEMMETISLGAHEARDGVSVMARRQERHIVTPSEIQSLPQLAAYLRFAYDAPVARIAVQPDTSREVKAEAFIEYDPDEDATEVFTPQHVQARQMAQDAFGQLEVVDQLAEFDTWYAGDPDAEPRNVGPRDAPLIWQYFASRRLSGMETTDIEFPTHDALHEGGDAIGLPKNMLVYEEALAAAGQPVPDIVRAPREIPEHASQRTVEWIIHAFERIPASQRRTAPTEQIVPFTSIKPQDSRLDGEPETLIENLISKIDTDAGGAARGR